MKWLQEKVVNKNSDENIKFVKFVKGSGNSKITKLILSKALIDEAKEKEFVHIRIGFDEKDGEKFLGFNMNKSYGGIYLKNKHGIHKNVFNISKYLDGYKEEGIELPLDQKLELNKDGQNYIYKL